MISTFSSRSFVSSSARMSLAVVLTVLMVFPDGVAFAQDQACNTTPNTWVQVSTSTISLAPPGSPTNYGVETFATAVATVNGTSYLYALGGMNCNIGTIQAPEYSCTSKLTGFQNQVGRAVINSDGSLAQFAWQPLWTSAGLGRDLCGVIYTSPTTGYSYIYTVGGLMPPGNSPVLTNQIWYAQLNASNTYTWYEATWPNSTTKLTLPSPLDLEGLVVLNGYLYIIGGSTNADPTQASGITSAVWSAPLDPSSGNLVAANTTTGFTQQPAILPPPQGATYTGGIYKTCPVAYPISSTTGVIYVAGGETNNGTSDHLTATVEYAVQSKGGMLTQWGMATNINNGNVNVPVTLASQAVVYNNGIILMGGQDAVSGAQDTDSVYMGTINSKTSITWPGTISSLLSELNPYTIERNAGATSGNYIYSLGGELSHNGTSSDSQDIYCLELP